MAQAEAKGTTANRPRRAEGWDWFFQPSILIRVSLVMGACALWPYVVHKLPALKHRPQYRLAFKQIQLIPAPVHPVPAQLVEQVAESVELPAELSILNEQVTQQIAQAFLMHPWVAGVKQVRKAYPAEIVVELEYRRPVAMVQYAGRRIPVDIEGVVLPGVDFSASDAAKFPLIQNVNTAPAAAGNRWQDPGLCAAARLADRLATSWGPLRLQAIVVPGTVVAATDVNEIPLELLTRGGSKILWGRPPGNDHPGELDPDQKIHRLEKYLSDFGDYEKPSGPYEIDIRHWQEISRRPMVTSQAQAPSKTGRGTKLRTSDLRKRVSH